MRTGNTLGNRILAVALSILMVLGMLPAGMVFADTATYATVTGLVAGLTVEGSGAEETVVTFSGELNWTAKDEMNGRDEDGWWIGIKVAAPDTIDDEAKYMAGDSVKSFAQDKDSEDDAEEQFIALWEQVKPEQLIAASQIDGLVSYTWQFDWDADDTYEQKVSVVINPEDTILKQSGFAFEIDEETTTYGVNYTAKKPSGGQASTITYSVENVGEADPAIAEIDPETGALTIHKAGTVKITATKGGEPFDTVSDSYILVIQKADQTGFAFENAPSKLTWQKDAVDALTLVNGKGEGAVTWAITAGTDVATVSADGKITLLKEGTFTIQAQKAGDDCYNASEVIETTIKVNLANQKEFGFGNTEKVTVTYNDNNNEFTLTATGGQSNKTIVYSVISGDAATVDENSGVVTILKAGTVVIQAARAADGRYNKITDTYELTIKPASQSFVLPNGGAADVVYGTQTYQIIPTLNEPHGMGALQFAVQSDKVGATVSSDGTVTFNYSKAKVGTVVIKVTMPSDDCYSEAVGTFTLTVGYPVVSEQASHTGTKTDSSSDWYTGDVQIVAPEGFTISTDNAFQGGTWGSSFPYTVEGGNQTVAYYLMNAEGHMTDKMEISGVYLDTSKPIVSISYSKDVWQRAVELLSFGFYQANVDVTFTAADAVSGLSYITYSLDKGVTYVTVNAADMVYDAGTGTYSKTITIEAPFDSWITCTATDNAGILSDEAYGSGTNLIVDKTAPSWIEPEYTNIVKTTDEILYATQDVSVKLAIMDTNFDLSLLGLDDLQSAAPVVTVNGTVVEGLTWTENTTTENQYETSFQITSGEGDYVLEVTYADRSQNEMTPYKKIIHVDKTAPKIVFEDEKLAATCINEALSTVITVTDHNFNPDTTVVYLSAVDKNGDVTVTKAAVDVTWVNDDTDKDVWTAVVEPINGDGIYTLEVESTDMALNYAEAASKNFIVDETTPTYVEILYSEPVNVFERVLNALTFGNYYTYGDKVEVTIKASDFVSGVKAFAWTYTRDDGVSVTNVAAKNGEIAYSKDGVAAQVTFVLTASEAEQFRGSVAVTVTDLAGNSLEVSEAESAGVVVDSVKPIIQVTYSEADRVVDATTNKDIEGYDFASNKADAVLYYSGKVEATIEITEANFDLSKDVKVFDGEKELTESAWTQKKDENGVLTDTWTASVTISEEGEHKLTVNYTDPSNNVMQTYTSELIVIDTTDPVAKITFSGAPVVNTIDGISYYADTVTATVTIQETNFRAENVKFLLTYKDVTGANVTAAETRSDWKSENGVHTITLVFDKDANYTLDVEYTDLAMRESKDVPTEAFTVDKTVPVKPTVDYSQSLSNAILHNITFGYYNGKLIVTVTAEDAVAGIDSFDFEYILNDNVSKVNKGGSGTVAAKQNGSTFTASFEVPAEALTKNNQFNGYIRFTATDRSGKSIQFTDDANALVVDNIAPNVQISYNAPVKTAGDTAYYNGNIYATIHVEEANFFSKDMRVSVEKNGAAYPVEVVWNTNYVGSYTGTFTLAEDGDYKVSASYTDRSNNSMAPYTSGTLTLDTKAPEVAVTNVVNNSANADKVYIFKVTVNDINADAAAFAPKLVAIVQQADGTFTTKDVSLGAVQTVEEGKAYAFQVNNLDEDAIYQLTVVASDMSGNATTKMLLDDGKIYEKVTFSINRNGSTFSLDDFTLDLVQTYYTQNVAQDLVVYETNVDELQECEVTLNGVKLIEDVDYKITAEGGNEAWMKYTYTVNKALFAEEGEYKLVIASRDAAGNDAFSDVKDAEVNFVVDRTAPVVSITGMTENGRYQVETQTVTLVPMDDGGLLNTLVVTMVDDEGNMLKEVVKLEGQQLWDALESGDGKLTFDIETGLYQNVRVACSDSAADAEGKFNTYDETVKNISVSSSGFMIFWANTGLRYGTMGGLLAVIAAAVLLLIKRKKPEAKK